LVMAGIGILPIGFLLAVAGIFLIVYGFSPDTAKSVI